MKACSSAKFGSPICRDGFLQCALCHGQVCNGCGQPLGTPMCQWDELPKHFIDAAGLPIMAEHRRTDLTPTT